MKKTTAGLALLASVVLMPAIAMEQLKKPIDQLAQSAEDNFPSLEDISDSAIDKAKDEYLSKRGMKTGYGDNESGRYYVGWQTATIDVPASDVKWPDAKNMAFEKALIKAKSDYIKLLQKTITVETTRKFLHDDRPFDPNEVAQDDSTLAALSSKIVALAESELDGALKENGIDPSQYDAVKKRKLLEDSIEKSSKIKAYGSVSGITTLRTFEDGNSVGVLFVVSDKLKQSANNVLRGSGSAANGTVTGKNILAQLQEKCADDACYISQDGIRLMKDEYGNETLVSFASSGVTATKGTSKLLLDKAVEAAEISAAQQASARMAEFANASLNFEEKANALSNSSVTQETNKEGFTTDKESVDIGKMVQQLAKQQSSLTIKGETTIKRWRAKHPQTGHLIVGTVTTWSALTRDNTSLKPSTNTPASNGSTENKKLNVQQSADFEASF